MARKLTTGFETGVLADEVDSNVSASIDTSVVRTGGYSVALGRDCSMGLNFPDGLLSEFYLGIAFNWNSVATGHLDFCDANNNVVAMVSLLASRVIRLTCNSVTADTAGAYADSEWHYFEIHFKFANSGGAFELKVDGASAASITGDTEQDTYLAPLLFRISGSAIGCVINIDDIVLNDTTGDANNSWPGRVKLYPMRPSAAGDVTQLSRGGTDSGANWSQVDEVPANVADYVYDSVADRYDLYNLGNITLPAGYEISNVVTVQDVYLDSGSGKITGVIKSGTEAQGSDHVLTNTAHAYSDAFPLTPGDDPWDQTAIDALQAGPKVR